MVADAFCCDPVLVGCPVITALHEYDSNRV